MARAYSYFMLGRKAKAVILAVALSGCVPSTAPPELKPTLAANQIQIRVQELERTVIAAYNADKTSISKEKADLIVKFCMSASSTLTTVPAGWPATIIKSWDELNKLAGTPTDTRISTVWALLNGAIGALK